MLFGERCVRHEGSALEKIEKFSREGETMTISDFPGLDADLIYLLDDIIASGATSRECIRAMRAKDCSRIAVIALAKRVE